MTRTSAQRDHRRESASQKARSILRRRGRPEVRRRLASCWRRARFSSANSARVWRAERNVLMRLKSRATIVKQCRESAVTARPTCRSAPPSENGQLGWLPGEPQVFKYVCAPSLVGQSHAHNLIESARPAQCRVDVFRAISTGARTRVSLVRGPGRDYTRQMQTRRLGSLKVSIVGLGCNNFGGRLDAAATANVVSAAIEAGITLFDTADIYGGTQSEVLRGQALGDQRHEIV